MKTDKTRSWDAYDAPTILTYGTCCTSLMAGSEVETGEPDDWGAGNVEFM